VTRAFKLAHALGKIVSFDPNYSPRIWPNRQDALHVLSKIFQEVTITKPSLDDAYRLFGAGDPPELYIARFHTLGPEVVVFTMGAEGTLLSYDGQITHIPARKVEVVDATGAGDAFWAGFLTALLDGNTLHQCALFARQIAERKLTTAGPLPGNIDRQAVYKNLTQDT
jgi:fructokinase